MPIIRLDLPESLHKQVRQLAERDGISINQFLMLAAAEKVSALLTADYLGARAVRGKRERFDAVLAKVPDVPPTPGDELP